MRLADMLANAENDKIRAPGPDQLHRLATLGLLAWGDEYQLQYGFTHVKDGIRIYVKQKRRDGAAVIQEGSDTEVILDQIEGYLCRVAASRMGVTESAILALAFDEIVGAS